MVFMGPSGRGKTTLSRLLAARGWRLIEDELLAVRKQNGHFIAEGTPFGEKNPRAARAPAVVERSFLLEHGDSHRTTALVRAAGVTKLCGCVKAYGRTSPHIEAVLDTATEFAQATNLEALAFRPTPDIEDVLLAACFPPSPRNSIAW